MKVLVVVVGVLVSCAVKTPLPPPQIPYAVVDERLAEIRVGMWDLKKKEVKR